MADRPLPGGVDGRGGSGIISAPGPQRHSSSAKLETVTKPEDRFIHVRGLKLRYVDWGDHGPPLLLLHGDMRTSRSWDAVARELCHRFHVIALDARGHGDSDWPARGYSYAERVAELAEFCQLLGLRDATGVGHSSGGAVVTLCAHKKPGLFSSLVLLEPVVAMTESFQRRVSSRGGRPKRTWASREELYRYLRQHPVAGRWREDVIRDVVAHEARELPDGSVDMKWASTAFNWDDRRGDYFDLTPIFRGLGLPLLLIVSQERQYSYTGLAPVLDGLERGCMVVIEKSGHNMYMERPDAVAQAILRFAQEDTLPAYL